MNKTNKPDAIDSTLANLRSGDRASKTYATSNIDRLQKRITELEQQLKTTTEALDWVLKDYKGICREGFQPSANWSKRIDMADSVLNTPTA